MFLFSRKLDRVATDKLMELCLKRFRRDIAPTTGHIFAPSEFMVIYFVCGDFQTTNLVCYGYLYTVNQ